jgi:hypothetical protein
LITINDDDDGPADATTKFGRVLFADFDGFLSDNKKDIDIRIDNQFDTNEDFIEKISVINKNRFAIALSSGKTEICFETE